VNAAHSDRTGGLRESFPDTKRGQET